MAMSKKNADIPSKEKKVDSSFFVDIPDELLAKLQDKIDAYDKKSDASANINEISLTKELLLKISKEKLAAEKKNK